MYYINNFFKIFYFLFFCLFFFFLFISNFFSIDIWNLLFFNYLILIFPIFERLLNFILKDFSSLSLKFYGFNILKYFFLILLFCIWYFKFNFSFENISILVFLIFSILFLIDSRFSFFMWLLSLSFVPIFMISNNNYIAEKFSIYCYYFLVIWVIISIFENIFSNKKTA